MGLGRLDLEQGSAKFRIFMADCWWMAKFGSCAIARRLHHRWTGLVSLFWSWRANGDNGGERFVDANSAEVSDSFNPHHMGFFCVFRCGPFYYTSFVADSFGRNKHCLPFARINLVSNDLFGRKRSNTFRLLELFYRARLWSGLRCWHL